MAKKFTRAERYKRNYRLIKNAYQDATLAKAAQSWSDQKLYDDLGVKVTKSMPKLRQVPKTKKAYYNNKLIKFLDARDMGVSVKYAKQAYRTPKVKVLAQAEYNEVSGKKRVHTNKKRRMKLWGQWSTHFAKGKKTTKGMKGDSNFPPELEEQAVKINRSIKLANGKRLDDHADYGYVATFYMFVEGKTYEETLPLVRHDPHDAYKYKYDIKVRAV